MKCYSDEQVASRFAGLQTFRSFLVKTSIMSSQGTTSDRITCALYSLSIFLVKSTMCRSATACAKIFSFISDSSFLYEYFHFPTSSSRERFQNHLSDLPSFQHSYTDLFARRVTSVVLCFSRMFYQPVDRLFNVEDLGPKEYFFL